MVKRYLTLTSLDNTLALFRTAFVPVAPERYEIMIRNEHLDDPRVAALCNVIGSSEFKGILDRLCGYDTKETAVRRKLR